MDGENEVQIPEEVIKEAELMGWKPKEKFKGKEEDWVDASEFVERGKHVMPILLENNKRLQGDIRKRDSEIDNLKEQVQNTNKILDEMRKEQIKNQRRALEAQKADLRKDLREAKREDDHDAQDRLEDALEKIDEDLQGLKDPEPPKKTDTVSTVLDKGIDQWITENSWYTSKKKEDRLRAIEFDEIAAELHKEGTGLKSKDFLDEAYRRLEEREGKEATPAVSKVAGNTRVSAPNGGGKGYNALPMEAKRACDADADRFVGPNKRYKKVEEYRASWANSYFED